MLKLKVKTLRYKLYRFEIAPDRFLVGGILLLSLLFVFLSQIHYVHDFSVADSASSANVVEQDNRGDGDLQGAISHYVPASQSYSQQDYDLFHSFELANNNHVVLPGNRAPPVL